MYVTGNELSNDRIFAYFLVYHKDRFKGTTFVDLVEEAIKRTKIEAPR